jgi:enoyl-CoA hydratase/carnithine racemase
VASVKVIVREALKDRGAADEALCDAWVKRCFASQDYIEGRRAFMEKRAPRFTGG